MSGSNSSPHADSDASASSADKPLGLAVHALPAPETLDAAPTRRGRWTMLAVLAVCAAPVLASYLAYYVWRPAGGVRNFGELIQPQRPMPALTVQTLSAPNLSAPNTSAPTIPLGSLRHQWLLLSVAGGACAASCEQHLYLQRQLREGLGKDRDRLDWVWLVNDNEPMREALRPALKAAHVLRVDGQALAQWLSPAAGAALSDHLYLIDPMGNWMMRFPAKIGKTEAGRVRRDLERLLRASSSWDQAGRPQ